MARSGFTTYTEQANGWTKWEPPPTELGCCDCGLVHRVKVRVRDGKVEWSVQRANGLTRGLRKVQAVQFRRTLKKILEWL